MRFFKSKLHQNIYNQLIEIEEWHFYIIQSGTFGFWYERGGDIIFYSDYPDVVFLGDDDYLYTDWQRVKQYIYKRMYDPKDCLDIQWEVEGSRSKLLDTM